MKVAVLLSGGVDSSVALKLLKNQGHELKAFYLKIWLEDELSFLGSCPWEEDLKFVEEVCETENIPLEIVSLQKEYFDQIVSYTIGEIKVGRTPNPDVLCNQRIKFGVFYDRFKGDFDKIATGHYADIEEIDGKFYLKRNPDKVKDQTYFLSSLSQEQLSKVTFPIAQLLKKEVRVLAENFKLPNMNRKDSQGLCFLGKIKFREFIKSNLGIKKGDIIDIDTGKKLGEHEGFYYYTIGQRHGLDLSGGPWFVVKKDTEKNIIYISNQEFIEDKAKDEFVVTNLNWIPEKPNKTNFLVKLRHGENFYNGTLEYLDKNKAKLKIDGKDTGAAPGQFAVFYDDKYCLGSGIISS